MSRAQARGATRGRGGQRGPTPRRGARRDRRPARPNGWPWLLVGPGALLVGVVLALLLAWRVDANAQTPGEAAAAAAEGQLGPVPAGGVPRPPPAKSYEVTYRITEPDTPTQTERRLIERPFYGRDVTYSSTGQIASGAVTGPSGAYVFLTSPAPQWGMLEAGTFRATGDDQPAPGLRLAVEHGRARVIGSRVILGRSCVVVRTGGPVGATVVAPTASNYADICIDQASGQTLDEVWVLDQKLVRERRAVSFTVNPPMTDSSFSVSSSGPAISAGTSGSATVVALTPTDISKLPAFMTAPPGYHLDGVLAQVTEQQEPGATAAAPVTTIFAHFVSGPNLNDLELGNLSSAPAGGIPVRLPDHRKGMLTIDLTASYIDVNLRGGVSVRLECPDLRVLLEAAARLR